MFTLSEKTVKKHTVKQMLQFTKDYLKHRYGINQINISSLPRRLNNDQSILLTIEELNRYSGLIQEDTLFDNHWHLINVPSGVLMK